MEKLLADIASKIQDSTDKRGVGNSPLVHKIINLIDLFKDSIINRIKRIPEAERLHVINLRDCRTKIAENLLELEALQVISEEQNLSSENCLKNILVCINDEEELIRNINETSEVEIPREIEESMSKILIIKEQEETKKKLLQCKINSAVQKLRNVVEFNAVTEKELFDISVKIEKEYIDFLAKYDHDIGASHALTERLLKNNEIIKAEKKNMEDRLAVQRTQYIQLKKEQEIELMKIFTEKLELFRRNRAAKIIQRTWKAYFERISLKKRRKTRRK